MCLQTGLQVGKGWWPRQHSTQMTGIGCCGFSEVSNRFLRFQLHVFYGGIVFLHWDQPQNWLKSGVILGALCSGATHDTVQVIKLGVQRQACKISLQQQMFLWIVPPSPNSVVRVQVSSDCFGTRSHIFPNPSVLHVVSLLPPLRTLV